MTSVTSPTIETERFVAAHADRCGYRSAGCLHRGSEFGRYMPKSKVVRTPRERAERLIGIYQRRWEEQPLNAMGWSATRKIDWAVHRQLRHRRGPEHGRRCNRLPAGSTLLGPGIRDGSRASNGSLRFRADRLGPHCRSSGARQCRVRSGWSNTWALCTRRR